jgi:hypothetical protein
MKKPSQCKKSENHFCSRSCSITYKNKHKPTGTRRSKLEVYIEEQIKIDFATLNMICNGKEAIGSELDFYFPELKLAIELNGIFHYEPIYGNSKLEQIKNNDKQKTIRCYECGIELCVIDASKCKYLTNKSKTEYYLLVKNLLTSVLNRKQTGE